MMSVKELKTSNWVGCGKDISNQNVDHKLSKYMASNICENGGLPKLHIAGQVLIDYSWYWLVYAIQYF